MKVLIKAGTRAWMIKDGVDSPTRITFPKDTMGDVERGDTYWYTIKGAVSDFPQEHSKIIINEVYIAPDRIALCSANQLPLRRAGAQ